MQQMTLIHEQHKKILSLQQQLRSQLLNGQLNTQTVQNNQLSEQGALHHAPGHTSPSIEHLQALQNNNSMTI